MMHCRDRARSLWFAAPASAGAHMRRRLAGKPASLSSGLTAQQAAVQRGFDQGPSASSLAGPTIPAPSAEDMNDRFGAYRPHGARHDGPATIGSQDKDTRCGRWGRRRAATDLRRPTRPTCPHIAMPAAGRALGNGRCAPRSHPSVTRCCSGVVRVDVNMPSRASCRACFAMMVACIDALLACLTALMLRCIY